MILALNDISSQQAKPTATRKGKVERLMDYAATCPEAYLRYYASDMKLNIDFDASYLVLSNAQIIIAGYYFFKTNNDIFNALICVECKAKHVVSSAAK